MKYMLLMYADESIVSKFTPEEHQAAAQAWYAFGEEAKAAGVLVSNNGLRFCRSITFLIGSMLRPNWSGQRIYGYARR